MTQKATMNNNPSLAILIFFFFAFEWILTINKFLFVHFLKGCSRLENCPTTDLLRIEITTYIMYDLSHHTERIAVLMLGRIVINFVDCSFFLSFRRSISISFTLCPLLSRQLNPCPIVLGWNCICVEYLELCSLFLCQAWFKLCSYLPQTLEKPNKNQRNKSSIPQIMIFSRS